MQDMSVDNRGSHILVSEEFLYSTDGFYPDKADLGPTQECEKDKQGEFTKAGPSDSQTRFSRSHYPSCSYVHISSPPVADRGFRRVDGSDPPFLVPRSGTAGWRNLHSRGHPLGGSLPSQTSLAGRRSSQSGSRRTVSGRFPTRTQELRPLLHQGAPSLEQIRAGIGRFHLILDKVRQRRLHDRMGRVRAFSRPVAKAGTESVRHSCNFPVLAASR